MIALNKVCLTSMSSVMNNFFFNTVYRNRYTFNRSQFSVIHYLSNTNHLGINYNMYTKLCYYLVYWFKLIS